MPSDPFLDSPARLRRRELERGWRDASREKAEAEAEAKDAERRERLKALPAERRARSEAGMADAKSWAAFVAVCESALGRARSDLRKAIEAHDAEAVLEASTRLAAWREAIGEVRRAAATAADARDPIRRLGGSIGRY